MQRSHSWITSQNRPLTALLLTVIGPLASGCAGKGASFDDAGPALRDSCAGCHDAAKFDAVLTSIRELDNALFTADAFPTAEFPAGLVDKTTASLIAGADPASDAQIDASTPQRKAWVLHEMHELEALLAEDIPPDFTDQQHFDSFATLGENGFYEGCEVGEKLDLGHAGDPEGMPPQWADKLFELLGGDALAPLSNDGRQNIRDYVDGLLPGGLKSCEPGEDSAS